MQAADMGMHAVDCMHTNTQHTRPITHATVVQVADAVVCSRRTSPFCSVLRMKAFSVGTISGAWRRDVPSRFMLSPAVQCSEGIKCARGLA